MQQPYGPDPTFDPIASRLNETSPFMTEAASGPLATAPAVVELATGQPHLVLSMAEVGPIWNLNVVFGQLVVRQVTVIAPSADCALEKGREQLDEGELLSYLPLTQN